MRPGPRFYVAMAWRETRAAWRRLIVLVGAIAVGIGALVAIRSFTAQVQDSVRRQGRELLGADVVVGGPSAFSPEVERTLAAIAALPGAREARFVRFSSMAFTPGGAGTRLVQVVATDGRAPFYGAVVTDPPGLWQRLATDDAVLADPALLLALGARPGDTLALGEGRFRIAGTVTAFPGDVAIRSAFGPRVFVPDRLLPQTRLLGFGARVRYEAHFSLPEPGAAQRLAARYRAPLAEERVSLRTALQEQENLSRSLGRMGEYLGIVALAALLLAGLAVASAVHVFVQRRIETLAVLRCLGASANELIGVFLLQAAALGLAGSATGAVLGMLVQALLPRVFAGLLPVDVSARPSAAAVGLGVGLGLWTALVASLPPLVAIRRISPLAVFRRPYERAARRDAASIGAWLLAAASVVGVAVLETGRVATGAWFAAGIGAVVGVLAAAAWLLARVVRRFFPHAWPYVWRQGVANLFRPANQTVTVVLALGFGAFLLDTLFVVQHNLLGELRAPSSEGRPNVVLFDIQPDQRAGVESVLRGSGLAPAAEAAVVPMRIRAVNGVAAAGTLRSAAAAADEPESRDPWALRREYRSTHRDALTPTERTASGAFWAPGAGRADVVPISIETRLARELHVRLGDTIDWDVQGVTVRSRVAHLRDVEWARFEPNFFVVFPEGPLDGAPQTFVTMTRVADPAARAALARRVAQAYPNVSVLDVTDVQKAIETVLGRAAQAVRFVASFSLLTGAIVLVGAVATSRRQRLREAVLLRTLGATGAQLAKIAIAEYASLGVLAAAVGMTLSAGAGWALARFVFDQRFVLPALPMAALAAALVALAVGVGVGAGREVLRRPPLEELRAE